MANIKIVNKKIIKFVIIAGVFTLIALVFGFWFYKSNIFKKQDLSSLSSFGHKKEEAEKEFEEKQVVKPFEKTEFRGKLAFERDRDIWSVDAGGSSEERLTDYQGLWSPVFSPNGQWIAYSSIPLELKGEGMAPTPSNIWIITPDGKEYKKLSQKYRVSTGISWSPDSRKIAIATSDSTIVVFDIETGDELEFVRDAGPLGVTPYSSVWVTANTFVYFKKLVSSPDKAGLGLANIKSQETKWLVEKPDIQKVVVSSNGEKLFYLLGKEFFQVNITSKKETKMNWDIPQNAEFIGGLRILKKSNILMTSVRLDEEKTYSGLHLDFILIDTNTGKTSIKRTGLQFKKGLGWDCDGYWLVLNAVSPNDDISAIWKVNLESGKKQQIISNAYSSTWHF